MAARAAKLIYTGSSASSGLVLNGNNSYTGGHRSGINNSGGGTATAIGVGSDTAFGTGKVTNILLPGTSSPLMQAPRRRPYACQCIRSQWRPDVPRFEFVYVHRAFQYHSTAGRRIPYAAERPHGKDGYVRCLPWFLLHYPRQPSGERWRRPGQNSGLFQQPRSQHDNDYQRCAQRPGTWRRHSQRQRPIWYDWLRQHGSLDDQQSEHLLGHHDP